MHPRKPLSEQRPEAKNQVINAIRHSNERWEKRLTLDNRRLVERHCEGNFHILTHFLVNTREFASHSNHCTMLVHIIESIELPENVALSSLVWFDCVDSLYRRLLHTL